MKKARRKAKSLLIKHKPLTRAQKLRAKKDLAKTIAERRYDDPFYIHPDEVPKDKAWQWFALKIMGNAEIAKSTLDQAVRNGWKPVLRNKKKVIVKDNILMEHSRKYVAECKEKEKASAKEMLAASALNAAEKDAASNHFPVAVGFAVSTAYEQVAADAPPIVTEIAVQFNISRDWQDAAAYLRLSPQEYARRRLLMEPLILAGSHKGPHHDHHDHHVYEVVNITVKP